MNVASLHGLHLIGLAGHIGSGKSAAAAMVPEAHALQWADPLYRGLAAMLDVPEEILRDRATKERPIVVAGLEVVSRHLARTLGTDWGREMVHPDIWVALTADRIACLARGTGRRVFAICGTRFLNELALIHAHGGEVWWLDRPGTVPGPHASDRVITREHCDRAVENDGTLDQLRMRVEAAWAAYRMRTVRRAGA